MQSVFTSTNRYRKMGVCGSDDEGSGRRAKKLAPSRMMLTIQSDHTDECVSTTAYGLETVGELLQRQGKLYCKLLKLPAAYCKELELEFCDVVVPRERALQDAGIMGVRMAWVLPWC